MPGGTNRRSQAQLMPRTGEADRQPTRIRWARRWLLVGGVAVVGLLVATYLSTRNRAVEYNRRRHCRGG